MDWFDRVMERLRLLAEPFYDMWRSALAIRNAMWAVFGAIGFKFIHIYRSYVPGVANEVTWTARLYTNDLVTRVANDLQDRILQAIRHTERLVSQDRATIAALTRSVTDRLNQIWAVLTPTAQLVRALLTNPERMAEWLVAAMVRRILSYLWGNSDRILLWLLRSSPAATVKVATEVEKLLMRVL